MRYLVPGFTSLLLLIHLLAVAQVPRSGVRKPATKGAVDKKVAPPAATAPAGLVVPSWLPAEAPCSPRPPS
ncbi:hypothetical protein ACFQT0_08175 [Hymenobacter humi]|uniref:Uncharacterized protein n=1 Tax=Hymenobacter humi TaxID=1411620 RepID=A0ABW2U1N8_9BACT